MERILNSAAQGAWGPVEVSKFRWPDPACRAGPSESWLAEMEPSELGGRERTGQPGCRRRERGRWEPQVLRDEALSSGRQTGARGAGRACLSVCECAWALVCIRVCA